MRAQSQNDIKSPFQRRAEDKKAQREALFDPQVAKPGALQAYAHRQAVVNPQEVSVGKPLFAPWN